MYFESIMDWYHGIVIIKVHRFVFIEKEKKDINSMKLIFQTQVNENWIENNRKLCLLYDKIYFLFKSP